MGYIELDETGPPPIFVLSHERSGSTLLRTVLDTHSQIACAGELMLSLTLKHLTSLIDGTLGVGVPGFIGPEREAERALEVRRVINGIMKSYARAKGKTVWCEKSPHEARNLPDVLRIFPDAKFVCLHRDCLDVVSSCIEGYSRNGFPGKLREYVSPSTGSIAQAMIASWVDETEKIVDFEAKYPKRCFRIRYEEMVRDPAAVLPPLFEFLGIAWEPEITTRVFEVPHDQGHGDETVAYKKSFDTTSIGKGAQNVSLRRVAKHILARADSLQAKLGYAGLHERQAAAQATGGAKTPGKRTVVQEALDVFIQQVFKERMPETLRANAAQMVGLSGKFKFIVTDGIPRVWSVSYNEADMTLGNDNGPAQATVRLDQTMLLEIAARRTTLLAAYRGGVLGYDGNSTAMTTLANFF